MSIVNNSLVSIIIPTYGRSDMLDRAIESVLAQTYKNIEIIIVNDNNVVSEQYSKTLEVLSKYRKNTKIKIISDGENIGGSLARNKGITASEGEYITFLDDDDYYYPEKIELQIQHITENNLDISVCNMDILKNGKIIWEPRANARVIDIKDYILKGNCYTPMIFAKKSAIDQVGGFSDVRRFQDHILVMKLLQNNLIFGSLNKALFVHNDHMDFRITQNTFEKFKSKWDMEEKFLNNLTANELKKYRFNRILEESLVFRSNNMKNKAFNKLILNFKNVNCTKNFFKNIFNIFELFKKY